MMKISFEVPFISLDQAEDKIVQQFYEKIVESFNQAFQIFQGEYFYLIKDVEQGQIGWGAFRSLSAPLDNDPVHFVKFYLNGKAIFTNENSLDQDIECSSWEDAFKLIFKFIKSEISQFEKAHVMINKIESAIETLQ